MRAPFERARVLESKPSTDAERRSETKIDTRTKGVTLIALGPRRRIVAVPGRDPGELPADAKVRSRVADPEDTLRRVEPSVAIIIELHGFEHDRTQPRFPMAPCDERVEARVAARVGQGQRNGCSVAVARTRSEDGILPGQNRATGSWRTFRVDSLRVVLTLYRRYVLALC